MSLMRIRRSADYIECTRLRRKLNVLLASDNLSVECFRPCAAKGSNRGTMHWREVCLICYRVQQLLETTWAHDNDLKRTTSELSMVYQCSNWIVLLTSRASQKLLLSKGEGHKEEHTCWTCPRAQTCWQNLICRMYEWMRELVRTLVRLCHLYNACRQVLGLCMKVEERMR